MEQPKVLIVDDRIENIISLETVLQSLEVEFIRAESGEEALQKTLDYDFAIMLIDVQMPEMDGFETVKLMRKVNKTRYTPVIFISAIYTDEYYTIKGIKSGAVDFITKPIVPEIVIGKVKIFLELFQQRSDLQKEIAARKEIEHELQMNREHVKLINRILRHDLNNNMAVIKSALNLYRSYNDDDMLNSIEKVVYKSVNLIHRMKNLEAIMIMNKQHLKTYNLLKIINSIKDKNSNIELNISGNANVFADDSIISVFDNLINNAITHGQTSKIDISIEKETKYARIEISDFGVGIPDNIKAQIFEENFAYGDTGQSGLGLYIVKKAIDHYGGHISVKDNEPSGTTFTLELIYA